MNQYGLHLESAKGVNVLFGTNVDALRHIGRVMCHKGGYFAAEIWDPNTAIVARLNEQTRMEWVDIGVAQAA